MNYLELGSNLPFTDVSDGELREILIEGCYTIPYVNLTFDPSEAYDKFNFEVNPENYLDNALVRFKLPQYIDVEQFCTLPTSLVNSSINVVSHNIRSLPKKLRRIVARSQYIKFLHRYTRTVRN